MLIGLPLEAPIGLSPLLILTLCGSERVLVVSTKPPDDLSCWTTPGVGRPGDGAVARRGGGGLAYPLGFVVLVCSWWHQLTDRHFAVLPFPFLE